MTSDSIVSASRRPGTSSYLRGSVVRKSARELAAAHWTMIDGGYPIRLLKGAFAIIYGPPGAGKSSMLVQWLNGFKGRVVLFSTEEGVGPSLSERFSRLNIRRDDFVIVAGGSIDEIAEELTRPRASAFAIDSLSQCQLLPSEVRRLQESTGVPVFLATLQVTKDHRPAGSNAWLHEADIVCRVDSLGWTLEKTRYQESVGQSGPVLLKGAA